MYVCMLGGRSVTLCYPYPGRIVSFNSTEARAHARGGGMECFDRRQEVECNGGRFTVYSAGFDSEPASSTVAVCLHGAGHAACSFALSAKILKVRYLTYVRMHVCAYVFIYPSPW